MFDRKEFLDAWKPPQVKDLDGTVYTGVLISHPEYLRLIDELGGLTLDNWDRVIRSIITAFGLPPEVLLGDGNGRPAWERVAIEGAVLDFFARQRVLAVSPEETPPPSMPANASPAD